MTPVYRADHVGSLLRPQELLDARNNPQVTRDQRKLQLVVETARRVWKDA